MSLIDRGNRTALVRNSVMTVDERGNRVPKAADTAVPVQCFVMPAEADVVMSQGAQSHAEFDLYCRVFPAGPWAQVEVNSVAYEVIGQPKVWDAGTGLSGTVVRIKEL